MSVEMVRDGRLGGYFNGGDPGTWCPTLWRRFVEKHQIRSVLDVGCGEGQSTQFFRDLGCEVLGVEGSAAAIRNSPIRDAIARHDFRDGPFKPGRRFDLIWTCEFLEHIEEEFLPHVAATLELADRYVLATHAFPGQRGHHHVNCRPSSYWIAVLAKLGFATPLGETLSARHATLGDHHRVNHFVRSGLVAKRVVPFDAQRNPQLADLRDSAQRPSWSDRWKGRILYRHFRTMRIAKKLLLSARKHVNTAAIGERAPDGRRAA